VTDAALVGRLLAEYHDRTVPAEHVRLLSGSPRESQVTYLVPAAGGGSQVIRAFRADEPAGWTEPGVTVLDWLTGRAGLLAFLAAAGYPAPRPVPARSGELIGVTGPWLTWATAFAPGRAVRPTLPQLRRAGKLLARLHSLDPAAGSSESLPRSSRHPAVAVPATLARLDAVTGLVPPDWRDLEATLRATAESVRAGAASLAEAIVHGDVWARNVVDDDADHLTLVDWETGGLGLAVLDLGNALVECHLDAALPDDQPEAWLITPNAERIGAFAGGYASLRPLAPDELALLPDAARYPAAIVGAVHFEAALAHGAAGPAMDARLARLRNRVTVAAAIAGLAAPHLIAS
jgi:Ser/Thr protein kinase RdoA (MazF antagonist)